MATTANELPYVFLVLRPRKGEDRVLYAPPNFSREQQIAYLTNYVNQLLRDNKGDIVNFKSAQIFEARCHVSWGDSSL